MTIYLDNDYKCHVSPAEGLTAAETDFFDGKCKRYIEGYRFVPDGQTWTREDGEVFCGEMISPAEDSLILEAVQSMYEETSAQLAALEADNADKTAALEVLGGDGMSYYAKALKMRPYIEKAAVSLSDADALKMPTMFKAWEAGITVAEGERLLYKADGKLYRVNKGMEHSTQAGWTPDKTPAMFSVVTDGSQAGTIDEPVDASRNMEYEYGKYYRDPEDGLVYLCKSGTETGSVILAYLPHELTGQYFEAA